MQITKTQPGVLSLEGRLDTVTAPKLQEALSEVIVPTEKENIELDFAGVGYVSSAGLRVLLQGQKNAKAAGKNLTLKNVSPEIIEVFDITGFSSILTII